MKSSKLPELNHDYVSKLTASAENL